VPEAELRDSGSGLAPAAEGWFVVNVRDAEWWLADSRGARCSFENEYGEPAVEFPQLGINLTVLEPGQTSLYHAESPQEAFLVLSGECRLLVEGEERVLRPWDFFHAPPWTEHGFVGAGDGPCVILMAGARGFATRAGVRYPASELAARYGASVEEETSDPAQAYAAAEWSRRERPAYWACLPWA
jgi:quercetin dioxygenase-like cupin family protein